MLRISLPRTEFVSELELELEHSLVSLSKWESMYEKPFYGKEDKTPEETKTYIRQMILTPDVPDNVVERFKTEHYNQVTEYINSKQTATWFSEMQEPKRGQPEAITAELIYYWMISFQIPFDPCEHWHLNRLMTLIRIAGIKQAPPKKMGKAEWAAKQRALNEQRRQQMGSSG